MGLFSHGNEVYLTHLAGIDQYGENWALSITQTDTELIFRPRAFKDRPAVHLELNKIESAQNENFRTEKNESMLARAIVGDLLFGRTGAVVGAMSAGKKSVLQTLYVIRYQSDGQEHAIVLKDNGSSLNFKKWQKSLLSKIVKDDSVNL